jgi:hypothetical protein
MPQKSCTGSQPKARHLVDGEVDDDYVPAQVKEWFADMQESCEQFSEPAIPSPKALVFSKKNDVEVEVIHGGRRKEDGDKHFRKRQFESKEAHQLSCLLASVALLKKAVAEDDVEG